ncbi:MAG: CHAT domain-containing protein [Terracidiphilus sp.]
MARYADLEIALRKQTGSSCSAAFRYNSPCDDAEQRSTTEPVFTLDPAALNTDDPEAYASALSAAFFTPELLGDFRAFRAAAASKTLALRVRLTIDPAAPELHAIHWETLRDPDLPPDQPNAHLFTGEQTVVSRFLSSGDWRPIRRKPKGSLRALAAIANPASTATYSLAPVDVPAELASATQALSGIDVTALAPGGAVALNDLAAKLREGFDILYLVCHGKIVDDNPYVFLDEGRPVNGLDLVQAIRELDRRPLLVVLASCQSAGKSGVGLAGLGPQLAEAGVAAVIAMQGNVFMTTATAFVSRFFTELRVDGQVDRAVSVARGQVRNAIDYWMPALFMRLRDGCIWYEPGFSDASFDKWPALCDAVGNGAFVPILGPEIGAGLFGGSDEISADLAQANNFPLADQSRSDLAKVTQFIGVRQGREFACNSARDELRNRLARRLSPGPNPVPTPTPTLADLCAQAAVRCSSDPASPYRILSDLRAPIYVNAAYESTLFQVLKAQGRAAEAVFIPWRTAGTAPRPTSSEPTRDAPWVFHAFGLFDQSRNADIVLTEDDFFDYLIVTTRLKLQPDAVSGTLNNSSLLFLGFRLDDWRFRVLFRTIANSEGAGGLAEFTHIGVQVNPNDHEVADVERARNYLNDYFKKANRAGFSIDVYWGTPEDFFKQLQARLNPTPRPSIAPVLVGGAHGAS